MISSNSSSLIYFKDLQEKTKNRFWINNPSLQEVELAISAGAINCTTNPTYCARLIQKEPNFIDGLILDVLEKSSDIDVAASLVNLKAAKRILEKFLPLYKRSDGACGYVTIQDDPRNDDDTEAIVRAALSCRSLGPNFMAKIPVIRGGLEAIEACVQENIPICATEVFSLAQAVEVCERYESATKRFGKRPPFFVTHISGIFDEYLAKLADRTGIDAPPELIANAGVAIAKKEYHLIQERGYKAILLGGGARGTHHFTEMVGGEVHVTINWNTAQEIMDSGIGIVDRLNVASDETAIKILCERFEDFRMAYQEDGLKVEEYASFGPVQLFRNAFLAGWYTLLAQVATVRNRYAI